MSNNKHKAIKINNYVYSVCLQAIKEKKNEKKWKKKKNKKIKKNSYLSNCQVIKNTQPNENSTNDIAI